MPQINIPARADVPIEETWNLESIFPSIEAWQSTLEETQAMLPKLHPFQGKLHEGPATLLACQEIAEKIFRQAMKVLIYSSLSSTVDTTNQEALARAGQGHSLIAKCDAAGAFIRPELLAIGHETLQQWIKSEPKLKIYNHYFDTLAHMQKHVCSSEVEEILAMVDEPLTNPYMTYASLVNADLKFTPAQASDGSKIEVGQSSYASLTTHPDREVRRTSFESYSDSYLGLKNTLARIQQGALQKNVFNMRSRHYNSSLEASLKPNNIPVEVFHNLIGIFQKNLPTWHKYWRIRRKALNLEKLHTYDIKAPLTNKKVTVPYQQAIEWICEGMAPLGEEYVKVLHNGCILKRWVDRARNKGKRQGAFSSGSSDTQPFIMMSYSDDVFSLSTLAHELGHSMHSYYTHRAQPFIYSNYSIFVAEVASNFNQAMLRDYLFKTQNDPVFQLALIEEAMSNFHRYFFIMPTLARWELEMHERVEKGEPINAQIMNNRCCELFKEGYGDEVVHDHERIGITWAQFQHMYMNFYVYQYATGISGAHALIERVLAEGKSAADDYLNFLKAGSSAYPIDALKAAGVDLTSPEPVEKAFNVLEGIVDRLENLLK